MSNVPTRPIFKRVIVIFHITIVFLTAPVLAANADRSAQDRSVMSIRINETVDDVVRTRRWAFLIEALDHTTNTYGPYVLEPYNSPMTAQREIEELLSGGLVNVMAADSGHQDLNENTIPIPIPIDKGLLGYRVSLIDKRTQARIDLVKGIDDLRAFSIGQGQAWGDLPIYKSNGLPVTTSSQYSQLFDMLARGRFDLFPRGAVEITNEFQAIHAKYPDLIIDQHLLIQYTYAQFFFVNKNYPLLARRIRDGLELMIKDGSFDRLFTRSFRKEIDALHLKDRLLIKLQNPYVPSWIPVKRKSLWLNPLENN